MGKKVLGLDLAKTELPDALAAMVNAWYEAQDVDVDPHAAAAERKPMRQFVEVGRFIKETYLSFVDEISATDLYNCWRDWAKDQGCEPCSMTRFGTEIKKVDGVTWWKTKRGSAYQIEPTKVCKFASDPWWDKMCTYCPVLPKEFSTIEALIAFGLIHSSKSISRADEMRIAPMLKQLGYAKSKSAQRLANGMRRYLWSLLP
jgi:phage/plasmid-associated DNA primase